VLRGEAEVALRGRSASAVAYREALGRVVEQAAEMARLVDDLLFLARTEADQVRFERRRVDLRDVLADAAREGRALARRRAVRLEAEAPDGPLPVDADPQRLRQAFVVLLDNAVKYSEPGQAVALAAAAGDDGWIEVTVSDRGAGIAPEDLPYVFDRFYRGRGAATGAAGGSGLGLPIAKWIVDKHGGEIALASDPGNPGGGTVVRLRLPAGGLALAVAILLVEDDPRLTSFVRRGLEAEGYTVDVAGGVREALARARAAAYPLVVLDRMLPDGDGLELCRTSRGEAFDGLVLMLTAKDAVQDKIEGLKGGADDYLTKPFAFDEFLVRIEVLLRRARPQAAGREELAVGDLRLDLAAKVAWRGARKITLTAKEFALLSYLMENAGTVVSRARLLSGVWGLSFDPGTKVVDVYIRYLRRKVDGGEATALIHTARGFGYTVRE
jgi:DNA-binding response OmpR family regulator